MGQAPHNFHRPPHPHHQAGLEGHSGEWVAVAVAFPMMHCHGYYAVKESINSPDGH